MITLISVNILIVIIIGIMSKFAFSNFNKSMFSDITNIYVLVIVIFPILIGIPNIVILWIKFPRYLFLAFLPFFVPVLYFLKNWVNQIQGKRKYEEFTQIKNNIRSYAHEFDFDIEYDDIRIRILPKNKIDIIINVYTKSHKELLDKIVRKTLDYISANKDYKRFDFNIYLDEKKSTNFILV